MDGLCKWLRLRPSWIEMRRAHLLGSGGRFGCGRPLLFRSPAASLQLSRSTQIRLPWSRFRKPPFSSRTAGFPGYGWRPMTFGINTMWPSSLRGNLSARSHAPLAGEFTTCCALRSVCHEIPALHVRAWCLFLRAVIDRESLCPVGVLPVRGRCWPSPRANISP